jgi:hypothetical protein
MENFCLVHGTQQTKKLIRYAYQLQFRGQQLVTTQSHISLQFQEKIFFLFHGNGSVYRNNILVCKSQQDSQVTGFI